MTQIGDEEGEEEDVVAVVSSTSGFDRLGAERRLHSQMHYAYAVLHESDLFLHGLVSKHRV